MQMQSVTASLPEVDSACAGHTPRVPLAQYVSAGQRVHGPPAAPWYPPTQTQSAAAELPAGEVEKLAHSTLAVPPGQCSSAVHAWHGPPSGPAWPASHVQSMSASLPASDVDAAGQE